MSGYRYSALVVDDEDAVRKLTVRALERHGFYCTEAQDGAEAARLLAARHYHALVSDLRMPNGNGYSLTTDVLERAERPLIVILTGVMEPRLAQDLLRRGVDDIMFKPVDYEMFAGKVAGLMQRRIDQAPELKEGMLPTDSSEVNGLATAREAKAMIDGEDAGHSNIATADTQDLLPQTSADVPCASQAPVVPTNADAPAGVDLVDKCRPNLSGAGVAPRTAPQYDASSVAGALAARVAGIRRWTATALRSLTRKDLAWAAAAGFLLFSIWLSMQVHMFRQMNRAVDALEQLGAQVAVSKTAGASVWFEPDRRPEGLGALQRVPDLRRLKLAHTRATNEDLATVGMLLDLEELDLQQTEITDSGLAHLEDLSRLQRLSLRGTHVTDAGLEHLKRLRALRALSLRETGVSARGARELQQAMPATRIDHASLVPIEAQQVQPGNSAADSAKGSMPKPD